MALANQSAVTEPFADFSVDTGLSQLALTRTYTSADWSYFGGPAGVFGRGWHHEWEAWLTCSSGGAICTVARGIARGFQFQANGTALSMDGSETWQVYGPWASKILADDNQNVLVRRPTGEWILFSPDGRELHFATACDTCANPLTDPTCQDPLSGGRARLVKVVDAKGSAIQVSYNSASGLLLGLADDLGHSLQLQTAAACVDGHASTLVYDLMTIATYGYTGADLTSATDADGHVLRSYSYDPGTGRLLVVKNESGDAIASFSYDANSRATGVVDKLSNVEVNYISGGAEVTEYFGNTSATGVRTLNQDGGVTSISDGSACGPPKTFTWTNRRLTCTADTLNHVAWQDFDAVGRLTHRAEYSSAQGCSEAPGALDPATSREEWHDYGLVRHVAQGVDLQLEIATAISRRSTQYASVKYAAESLSYDPTSQPYDPSGYACQQSPLPTGSVLCRRILGGYTANNSGSFERQATFYSYDARGRLIKTWGPVNLDTPSPSDLMPVEERVYWSDTEALQRRGRLMKVKRYQSPTAANPLVTSYDYDAFGPYQVTQPNGGLTTIVKDGRGRPSVVIAPDGAQSQTRYHDGLDPRVQILAGGAAVRSSYDSIGRLRSHEYLPGDPDASGASTTVSWGEYYTYDAAGNRVHTERRDASGQVTWQQDQQYDVQHRLVSDTNPAFPSTAKTMTFDVSGFLSGTTDEQGRGTGFTADALNRVKKVTKSGFDPISGAPVALDVATYGYQASVDYLGQVSAGNGVPTSYQHDDFGRVQQVTYNGRLAGMLNFKYDARGNLLSRSDTYLTISYTYDGLDRLLTVNATNSADGSSVAYTYRYDESPYPGQLTTVVEPDRTVTYTYDAVGRILRKVIQENGVAVALTSQYSYDPDGLPSQITYPSGLAIRFSRDLATHGVISVTNAVDGTVYANSITHYPAGPLRGLTFGNGLGLSQTLNRRYEPVAIASGPLSLAYTMTPAGDVETIAAGSTSRNFVFDFLDRIIQTNGTDSSQAAESTSQTYTYVAGTDRVAMTVVPSGTNLVPHYGFAYDYQGNVSGVASYDSSGTTVTAAVCLRHDALGRMRLMQVVPSGSLSTSNFNGNVACTVDGSPQTNAAAFKYDAAGRRIARWTASTGQWTYVVSDEAGNPLSELALVNGAWVPVRDYVWLDGTALAQIEYPGPTGSTQGYNYFYHSDHTGAPRYLTNGSRTPVWSATATTFGSFNESSSLDPISGRTVVTNLRLPGQYDERLFAAAGLSGLQGPYYNWNRWYLPSVGRYLELDPIALGGGFNSKYGVDWYSYAGGNPLRNIDPDGLLLCSPGDPSPVCKCKVDPSFCSIVVPSPSPSVPWWLNWLLPFLPFIGNDGGPPPPRPPEPPKPCDDKNNPKDKCWEYYVECLNGPVGSMMSNQFGHSQCQVCQEQCIQDGGIWPVLARNNKRCR